MHQFSISNIDTDDELSMDTYDEGFPWWWELSMDTNDEGFP